MAEQIEPGRPDRLLRDGRAGVRRHRPRDRRDVRGPRRRSGPASRARWTPTRGASRPSRRSCSTRTSSCRRWSWRASWSTCASGPPSTGTSPSRASCATVSDADAELLERRIRERRRRGGVIHERHYTLEEASELLPRVVELLERMRAARDRLGDREAREALVRGGPDERRRRPGPHRLRGLPRAARLDGRAARARGGAARPRPRPARLPLPPRRPRGLPVLAGGRGRDRVLARARGRLRRAPPARRWADPRAPRARGCSTSSSAWPRPARCC